MSHRYVVALGGSLLRPEESAERDTWFARLRQLVVSLEGNGHRLAVVVGGGLPAREGIQLASSMVSDSARLDRIGIAATRINATVIQQVLQSVGCDVADAIPHTVEEAANLLSQHSIVLMGGTTPGHTTDTVAVRLAASIQAKYCIIATNVSHVFNKDPREFDDAEAISEMTLAELGEITGVGSPLEPGASAVVDPMAVQAAMDASIDMAVLDGRDISRLDDALEGKSFVGTLIRT
ncbi:MAG: UMP kinase [Candidatus Poseidonia sp.]|nr:UMP kinase [Poseidonia sp.]